jgi:hypothetical protein
MTNNAGCRAPLRIPDSTGRYRDSESRILRHPNQGLTCGNADCGPIGTGSAFCV